MYSELNLITQDAFKTYSEFQVDTWLFFIPVILINFLLHKIRNISGVIDEVDFTEVAMCALINGEVVAVAANSPSVLTASGTYLYLMK